MPRSTLRQLSKGISVGFLVIFPLGVGDGSPRDREDLARPVPAQERSDAERAKQEEEQEAIEREMQQIVQLLRHAYEVAKDVSDPVIRIRSYAAIGEALWEHDRAFARQLLRTAFEEINQVPPPERPKDVQAWIGSTRDPNELRREILAKVAKLDPLLAMELAKSIETEKTEAQEPKREGSSDVHMRRALGTERAQALMNLAHTLLEKDPTSAIEAATAALSQGITQPFVHFLMRLRQKDPARADHLFLQALHTAQRNVPARLYELIPLGSYLAQDWALPIRLNTGEAPRSVPPALIARYLGVLLETLTHYVEIAMNPGLAPGLAQTDWFTTPLDLHRILTSIRPGVQAYLPDRAPVVEGLLNQLAAVLPRAQAETEPPESKRTLSPEERLTDLLRQAERTKDAEERDALLFRAILQALSNGDFETAASLVPRLSDVKQRAEVSDYVNFRWAEHALKEGDIETARRRALDVSHPERLAYLFGAMAQKLDAQKDKMAALFMLKEAEARIRRLSASPEQARALLLLAEAFLPLDADSAFEAFAHALGPLNRSDAQSETPGANFQLNFKTTGLVISVSERDSTRVLERVVTALTTTDPARTLMLLMGLENPPFRLIAHLAHARRHLEILKEKKAKLAEKRSE